MPYNLATATDWLHQPSQALVTNCSQKNISLTPPELKDSETASQQLCLNPSQSFEEKEKRTKKIGN